jgi:uncharacterized repeat protein (TIGR01451 family)
MTRTISAMALAMSATMAVAAVVALMMSILLAQEAEAQQTCKTSNGDLFRVCISNTASPNPVKKGKPLTYTVTVTNACRPDTPEEGCSFNDNIIDSLPAHTLFVSGSFTAPSGSGSCDYDNATRKVTCGSFFLQVGESATATIQVTPTKRGRFANTAMDGDFKALATAHYTVK